MFKHVCHNFYLGSEALDVMTSFTQQSARIHGFASRNQPAKIIFSRVSADVSFSPISVSVSVHGKLVESAVSDLLEEGPAPGPPPPNCGSHGCAGCSFDDMVSLVLVGRHG